MTLLPPQVIVLDPKQPVAGDQLCLRLYKSHIHRPRLGGSLLFLYVFIKDLSSEPVLQSGTGAAILERIHAR